MRQLIHNLKRTLVFLITAALTCAVVSAQPPDRLDTRFVEAFNAIAEAEAAGGNVTRLIDMMNTAVTLRDEGRETEAESMLTMIQSEAETERLTGVQGDRIALLKTVAAAGVLLGLSAAVWLRGSEALWDVWLRSKRGWEVERTR